MITLALAGGPMPPVLASATMHSVINTITRIWTTLNQWHVELIFGEEQKCIQFTHPLTLLMFIMAFPIQHKKFKLKIYKI